MRVRCTAHGGYFASGCSGCEESAKRRHEEILHQRVARLQDALVQEQDRTSHLRAALAPLLPLVHQLESKRMAESKRLAVAARLRDLIIAVGQPALNETPES